MTEPTRVQAPTVDEIERRFRSPAVAVARPVVLGTLGLLGVVCRYGWTAEGTERLPVGDGPLVFAANHGSHADTAAILGTLPRPLRRRTCVAAALDVFGPTGETERHTVKALRRECLQIIVAAGFHAFAFDRHGPPRPSLRTALDLVRRDWSLLLYPEGTRSRTGAMGPFKAGVGILAKSTGRPVIPVYVTGGKTILPCGTTFPRAGHARVIYGDPLHHRAGESAGAFTDRVRQEICLLARQTARTAEVAPPAREPAARLASVPPGETRKRSA